MPEATLSSAIESLSDSLAGVGALLGEPGAGGSGLAGAASLVAETPADRVGGFGGELTARMSGAIAIDIGPLTQIGTLLSGLPDLAEAPAGGALDGFAERLTSAATSVSGDAIGPMLEAIQAVVAISQGVPVDRTAVVSLLVDQIVAVFATLDGPEARAVQAWIDSVAEQARVLLPIIEAAGAQPDPAAVAVAVVERSLAGVLDTLGLGEIAELLAFADRFLDVTPDLGEVTAGLDGVLTGYGEVVNLVDAPLPQFRAVAVATGEAYADLRLRLRPVLRLARQVAGARILQPGAIEEFLRRKLDEALAVPVHETQKIDDPFQALFDRIDAAVDGIDLSPVREQVLGFFATTQEAIEGIDLGGVGDRLTAGLDGVEEAVTAVEGAVATLRTQVVTFFDELAGQVRAAASPLGVFLPDGSFRYRFEADLRAALDAARAAIAGDPANPGTPSVAGALRDFQSTIDGFAAQLRELLQPVDDAVATVVGEATAGVQEFAAFLGTLDVPAVLAEAQQQIQQVLDAIGTLDFAVVVDPVVAAIEEATETVREIDVSSLNETVRAGLAAALGVVVDVDFTAEVRTPLHDTFTAISKEAVDELREQVARLTAMLDELAPTQLLSGLFAAFDAVRGAVGSLDVATLLTPLDDAHAEFLQRPLEQVRPSVLLRPAVDAFAEATAAFAGLHGAAVVQPLQSGLDELRTAVAQFDVGGRIDEVVAAVDRVRDDLDALRPSLLLAPLTAEVGRLIGELDRFKPSVVFAPVTALATPLLALLEDITTQAIQALFDLFAQPLALLDRLRPEALAAELRGRVQALLDLLATVDIPGRIATLGVRHLELTAAVSAGGVRAKADLVAVLDPGRQVGALLAAYRDQISVLERVRDGLVFPDLTGIYDELRERLIGMLPPYARSLMTPEIFKRTMQLADPTRFLTELDARFDALKAKLLPISPDDIAAGLDGTWAALTGLLDGLDLRTALREFAETIERITGLLDGVSLDEVADAIDTALDDVRAVVGALDPARFLTGLDTLHDEVTAAVTATRPSTVLAGLQGVLDDLNRIVARLDLRASLGEPLDEAWDGVVDVVAQLDVGPLLDPLVNKLGELEAGLGGALDRVEAAFDDLLRAASAALSGSGSVSVGGSVGVGV